MFQKSERDFKANFGILGLEKLFGNFANFHLKTKRSNGQREITWGFWQ